MTPPVSSMVDGAKVAECYKGRMVLGGSGKVSFVAGIHTLFDAIFVSSQMVGSKRSSRELGRKGGMKGGRSLETD